NFNDSTLFTSYNNQVVNKNGLPSIEKSIIQNQCCVDIDVHIIAGHSSILRDRCEDISLEIFHLILDLLGSINILEFIIAADKTELLKLVISLESLLIDAYLKQPRLYLKL
ncbi:34979_t:CDS:2, partial [Racocetra persica]